MKIFLIVASFFISVLEAVDVQQVTGRTGGELSVQCFTHLTTNVSNNQYNMFFCKGPCSKKTLLVKRNESAIIQSGRYKMENNKHAIFSVTITRLRRTDSGRYFCALEGNDSVLSQEVIITVLEGASAPLGSFIQAHTLQTAKLSQDDLLPSVLPTAPSLTSLSTPGRANEPASSLTDTTIVIIVSVSLALLVCAIIPLIFYGHWRSSGEDQLHNRGNKSGAEDSDEHTDVPLAHAAVALQTDPENDAPGAALYTSVYEALDPKSLD